MGLDMSLSKRTYVKNWDHRPPEARHEITITKGGKPTAIKSERICYIIEEVGYWRKANQIHRWFVEEVQGGEDDCRDYYVSREQLLKLRDLCKRVLDVVVTTDGAVNHGRAYTTNREGETVETIIQKKGEVIVNPEVAEELLPTQSGCFFGQTDYDQFYLDDLRHTVEILDPLLNEDDDSGDYFYRSSW